ncbi:MAG: hydroxyacylglutathione hydrolase [Methylovulum miyakonense]|uniref:hydroxyacylglutathione hydrolase n=1 Tax=Methylovulum miyakonense TaxID=645578 RepID=UPI003BB63B31
MLNIVQIPVLTDNYIYLIHDPVSAETAVVDPAVAQPVLDELAKRGWRLSYIFNTHHHGDHVGGNLELQAKTACQIIGPAADKHRIPGIDRCVSDQDVVTLGNHSAKVLETHGHTSGHVVYYFASENALFCGDTLFVMGCGRLFDGTIADLWQSLQKLQTLPATTRIYCAHEYTQSNGRFALTLEPENPVLQEKMVRVNQLRANGQPTVPSTIAEELATNPFLRTDSVELQKSLGLAGKGSLEIFTAIRALKDQF